MKRVFNLLFACCFVVAQAQVAEHRMQGVYPRTTPVYEADDGARADYGIVNSSDRTCFYSTSMILGERGDYPPQSSSESATNVPPIRRVSTFPGDPFIDPVGEVPFGLITLAAAAYLLFLSRRHRRRHTHLTDK